MKQKSVILKTLLFSCLIFASIQTMTAWAITTGRVEWDWPENMQYDSPVSFTAPQTVYMNTDLGYSFVKSAISSNEINISFDIAGGVTHRFRPDGHFNGLVFKLDNMTITDIDVDQNTDAVVTWSENNIFIDFLGLYVDRDTYVNLDINPGTAAVPEPTTMLLLGLGLAGVAVARKKFRK